MTTASLPVGSALPKQGAPDFIAVADTAIGNLAVPDLRPDALLLPMPRAGPPESLVIALVGEGEGVDVDTSAIAASRAVAKRPLVTRGVVEVVPRATVPVPHVAIAAGVIVAEVVC